MPNWFRKDTELPSELKDKSPEDVAKELKEARELKEKLVILEADRAKERSLVESMKTEFASVKARLAEAESSARKPSAGDQGDKGAPKEPADFVTEPDRAFAERIQPLQNLTVQNAVMTSRMLAQQHFDNEDMASPQEAKTMNGRLFRLWSGELNEEAKKYPAEQMTNPQTWIGLFYLIKGRHADELANPETRKKKFNFVEPSSTTHTPPQEKKTDGPESLTDEEKRVADKMHVSYENYAKRKKSMQFVNA